VAPVQLLSFIPVETVIFISGSVVPCDGVLYLYEVVGFVVDALFFVGLALGSLLVLQARLLSSCLVILTLLH
jgi:hypothetical protein